MEFIKTGINGIYYKKFKNSEKVTYYAKFRHPITKKSVRRKLITKPKLNKNDFRSLSSLYDKVIEEEANKNNSNIVEDNKSIQNYMTLNELADKFFKAKEKEKILELKRSFTISENDFNNHQLVKRKIAGKKNAQLMYDLRTRPYKIATIPLNQITKNIVKKYVEDDLQTQLTKSGKYTISEKTQFNTFSQMKTIINWGIKNDLINIRNPLTTIDTIKNPKRTRERVLSKWELSVLLKECKRYNTEFKEKRKWKDGRIVNYTVKPNFNIYNSVYLAILTGARANTVLNIRKSDFDVKNRTIHLYNFKSNRKYKQKIPREAMDYFRFEVLEHYEDDEYIIRHQNVNKRKKEPMSEIHREVYNIMNRLFNEKIKDDNFSRDHKVNFHTLRRSTATHLANDGANLYDVMIFLNHTDLQQTINYLNFEYNKVESNVSNLMDDILTNMEYEEEETTLEDEKMAFEIEKEIYEENKRDI